MERLDGFPLEPVVVPLNGLLCLGFETPADEGVFFFFVLAGSLAGAVEGSEEDPIRRVSLSLGIAVACAGSAGVEQAVVDSGSGLLLSMDFV